MVLGGGFATRGVPPQRYRSPSFASLRLARAIRATRAY